MAKRWTTKEITQLSNVCYNRGLEKAQIRDMAGAVYELKRCLQLNKNHTQARNLLGLVYYETGEMADALAEWVISTNFQARENPAIQYINKLQERQEFLNEMIMATRKYNQALHLLREDSEDLAILQLNKVLSLNPHFVRAYQLLTLVFIKRHQYAKAEKTVKKALTIDRTNTVSLRYLNELKRIAYARKKKNLQDLSTEEASRFDGLSADDVIIPTYHGDILGGWATVVNLLAGLGIGLACFYYLLLPTQISAVSASYNQEIVQIREIQNTQDAEVSALTAQAQSLQEELDRVTAEAESNSAASQRQIANYQMLLQLQIALSGTDPATYLQGIATLNSLDVSSVTDETYLAVYQTLVAQVQANAAPLLLEWGKTSYDSRNYEAAINYLVQCLAYAPDSVDAMYYLGLSYKEQGDSVSAINWLTLVIEKVPGTDLATAAQTARGF